MALRFIRLISMLHRYLVILEDVVKKLEVQRSLSSSLASTDTVFSASALCNCFHIFGSKFDVFSPPNPHHILLLWLVLDWTQFSANKPVEGDDFRKIKSEHLEFINPPMRN